jgi:hypothetical protein
VWIRFPCSRYSEEVQSLTEHSRIFFSNLKLISSPTREIILSPSPGYQLINLGVSSIGGAPRFDGKLSCCYRDVVMPFECSCIMAVILFWDVGVDEITIYLLAKSMETIVLHYGLPRPEKLAKKLKWLKSGLHVQIKRVILRSFDSHNNIFVCCRSDHTAVDVVLNMCTSQGLNIPMCCSNEKRRFNAFQKGKLWYNSIHPMGSLHSCKRSILNDTTISIVAEVSKGNICVVMLRTESYASFGVCDTAIFPSQVRDADSLKVNALVCHELFDEVALTDFSNLVYRVGVVQNTSICFHASLFRNPTIRILLFQLL